MSTVFQEQIPMRQQNNFKVKLIFDLKTIQLLIECIDIPMAITILQLVIYVAKTITSIGYVLPCEVFQNMLETFIEFFKFFDFI